MSFQGARHEDADSAEEGPNLQFDVVANFACSLGGYETGFQVPGAEALRIKSEGQLFKVEDWKSFCQATNTGYTELCTTLQTAEPLTPNTKSIPPDSPFSCGRSTSSRDSKVGTLLGETSLEAPRQILSAATPPPFISDRETGPAYLLVEEDNSSEADPLTALSIRGPKDVAEQQSRWALLSPERNMEGSPMSSMSTVGSSKPGFYSSPSLDSPDHLGEFYPFQGVVNCGPTYDDSPQDTAVDFPAPVAISSPHTTTAMAHIFDDVDLSHLDNSQPDQPVSPTNTDPGEDEYLPLPLHLSSSDLLPPPGIAEPLSDCPPTCGIEPEQLGHFALEANLRARRTRNTSAKRSCKMDNEELEYSPHQYKKPRQGNKSKRTTRLAVSDDVSDYQPQERKKAAVTARGRKVNRLQLSEEDHSEDYAEAGNRRSKHHNPWTVEETEALVMGVESCGGGKWADIKKLGLRAIEKRSAVDLKDKWRNLQAALHRTKCDKKREIPASLLQRVKMLVPLTGTKARAEAGPAAARKQPRTRDRPVRQK